MHPIITNSKRILIHQLGEVYPVLIISLPLIILIRLIAFKINTKKGIKLNLWHEAGFLLLGLFSDLIISSTVIPEIIITENGITTNAFTNMWQSNLIPGSVIWRSISASKHFDYSYFTYNLLGNIAIFVPIGFFLPLLWKKLNFPLTVLSGFLFSLFIELFQLFLPRFTDIDDIILNTTGTVIGAGLYYLLRFIAPRFTEKFKYQ